MQRVARLPDIPADRGLAVTLGGIDILLVRDGDAVRALAAKCPHAGAPLAEGAVCDGVLICPWHKARFAIADGELLDPPALDRLATYPCEVAGDEVAVDARPTPPLAPALPADSRRMLVVGAGAAGSAAALALREFGFAGRITLIGREPGLPYDRTALSKFVTSGDMPAAEVPALNGTDRLGALGIEVLTATATALDAGARSVTLDDGRSLAYDAALLAPGGEPVRPDLPGADLAGVHLLRNRADAAALMAEAKGRAVILGTSFIGLEVASGLRQQGISVDLAGPDAVPFARQFGPELGSLFRELHASNGVTFHPGRKLARIDGAGHVHGVTLDDGTALPADFVLLATGVRPATGFVTGIDRGEDGGITVDAGMRAGPGLWAVGDSARFPLAGVPVRIEHWRVAQQQGRIAARNMLGGDAIYDGVPFFWTYQYGKRFEYLGHPDSWDETATDGAPLGAPFVTLFARHGQVVAALGCDREHDMGRLHDAMLRPLALSAARELLGF